MHVRVQQPPVLVAFISAFYTQVFMFQFPLVYIELKMVNYVSNLPVFLLSARLLQQWLVSFGPAQIRTSAWQLAVGYSQHSIQGRKFVRQKALDLRCPVCYQSHTNHREYFVFTALSS